MDDEQTSPNGFVLEMAAKLLVPPVTCGLGLAAVSGTVYITAWPAHVQARRLLNPVLSTRVEP